MWEAAASHLARLRSGGRGLATFNCLGFSFFSFYSVQGLQARCVFKKLVTTQQKYATLTRHELVNIMNLTTEINYHNLDQSQCKTCLSIIVRPGPRQASLYDSQLLGILEFCWCPVLFSFLLILNIDAT